MVSSDIYLTAFVHLPAPKICIQDWAFKNVSGDMEFNPHATCPYGKQIHAPASPFTWPSQVGPFQYFGIVWSSIPAAILFLNMAMVVVGLLYGLCKSFCGRTTKTLADKVREFLHRVKFPVLLYLFFPLLTGLVVANAEHGFVADPRPKNSCLLSCGMPSGHNVIVWGTSTLLFMDLMRLDVAKEHKRYILSFVFAITVPMLLARIATGDHTPKQVAMGMIIGITMGFSFHLLVWKTSMKLFGQCQGIVWPVYFGWLQFGWLPLPAGSETAKHQKEIRQGLLLA